MPRGGRLLGPNRNLSKVTARYSQHSPYRYRRAGSASEQDAFTPADSQVEKQGNQGKQPPRMDVILNQAFGSKRLRFFLLCPAWPAQGLPADVKDGIFAMTHEAIRETEHELVTYLQDVVLNSSGVEEFLDELASVSASSLSAPGHEVFCGVTLIRHKKASTAASSSARARVMDELQYRYGDGPCLTAIREGATVHVPDLRDEYRWPDYMAAVSRHGVRSILAVSFALEGDAGAGLNLYSLQPHGFSGADIERAETYARQASTSLRLALRIAQLTDAKNNLAAAMQSRTTIDLAVGVIMAQNRCSQETAFKILRNASSTRNLKLRDIAAKVLNSVSESSKVSTHFDE
jgi:GAF domain-containing protein